MRWPFVKYHGTGNDFIVIDDRSNSFPAADQALISKWCTRRFGIGADGLMLLRQEEGVDFRMIYFNSDGRESSMCGNGGRCIVQFAQSLGLVDDIALFMAIDGLHEAKLSQDLVYLKMQDVVGIEQLDLDCILNTGSPHFVRFQHLPDEAGLLSIARDIRYSDRFREAGININLAEKVTDGYLRIRTYERGVEAETFSCGTGAVACALSEAHRQKIIGSHQFQIETLGGSLSVAFTRHETGAYTDIWLIGPAVKVYEGSIRW